VPDLTWLPRATLMAVSLALAYGALRVFLNRVPHAIWSRYTTEQRGILRRVVSRSEPAIAGIARAEDCAAFEQLRRSVLALRRIAIASMVASALAFALSTLSRYA
jgi:hypothetical protein